MWQPDAGLRGFDCAQSAIARSENGEPTAISAVCLPPIEEKARAQREEFHASLASSNASGRLLFSSQQNYGKGI